MKECMKEIMTEVILDDQEVVVEKKGVALDRVAVGLRFKLQGVAEALEKGP